MADAYPDYDPDKYGTVPSVTGAPSSPPTVPSARRSMGAVEIGVIAIAIAVTILTCSAAISLSRR